MRQPPLPTFGLAADLVAAETQAATGDGALAAFVDRTAPSAELHKAPEVLHEHLVSFLLGADLFAVPVRHVREIVRVHALTRIPQAPEHVRGVQSLRGLVLPVLEIRTRIGLTPAELGAQSRIIVTEGRRRLIGLLVDAVGQVTRVPETDIRPPPPEVRTQLSEYVQGMAQLGERMALLLDLEQLLVLPTPSPNTSEDNPR